jgi:small-conductance mechanosensitive channel
MTKAPKESPPIWRLAKPVALALSGLAAILGTPWLGLSDEAAVWPFTIGRVLIIIACGWALMQIVGWRLRHAARSADISAANNLEARKLVTRLNLLRRVAGVVIAVLTCAAALMAIPTAREVGLSLFASAGVAGLVIGIAAQPVLANLIAGLQLAFTQPIRIDDAVVVEGEWGWIEEIDIFHVIVRIWDERRLVVPLKHFIEQPFQNWTRESAAIIGSVFWHVDYRAPIAEMREQLKIFCEASKYWDKRVCVLQVTDAKSDSVEIRALASASTSPNAWDLRCEIREKMIAWLQERFPDSLPRQRAEARILSSETAEAA